MEGYTIYDKIDKFKLGEKGIAQIKRKYSFDKKLIATTNPSIKSEHKLLIKEKKVSVNIIETTICYILPYEYGLTQILFLKTYFDRNVEIENQFLNHFIGDSIPKHVENSALIDSIDFVGRNIVLGHLCEWKGPHNVYCDTKGQMSWSIFKEEKIAKQEIEIQKQLTSQKWLTNVKSEEEVNVLFEEIPTTAIKTTVKINMPKMIMGESNTLIVYYVIQKIRNKYISCVLSYFTNDVDGDNLPPLLSEVMTIINE